ncbi:hypothetical protein CISIN_1g040519mg, partial [Citrus sinensis]
WSLIAGRLPGSTNYKIKNYWNTHIKQKLLNHGLDPQTHRPLNQIHNHNNFNKYTINNNEEIMHSSTHYQENLDLRAIHWTCYNDNSRNNRTTLLITTSFLK